MNDTTKDIDLNAEIADVLRAMRDSSATADALERLESYGDIARVAVPSMLEVIREGLQRHRDKSELKAILKTCSLLHPVTAEGKIDFGPSDF